MAQQISPVNTSPITVVVRKRSSSGYVALSPDWPGKTGESEAGPNYAATNLACRWFFGRPADKVSSAERDAIRLEALPGGRFFATLMEHSKPLPQVKRDIYQRIKNDPRLRS
jgi:hypothetical protein